MDGYDCCTLISTKREKKEATFIDKKWESAHVEEFMEFDDLFFSVLFGINIVPYLSVGKRAKPDSCAQRSLCYEVTQASMSTT